MSRRRVNRKFSLLPWRDKTAQAPYYLCKSINAVNLVISFCGGFKGGGMRKFLIWLWKGVVSFFAAPKKPDNKHSLLSSHSRVYGQESLYLCVGQLGSKEEK